MTDRPDETSPEERLEKLRFFAIESEGSAARSASLGDWMQEVERQIANLRDRLNEPPKRIVW